MSRKPITAAATKPGGFTHRVRKDGGVAIEQVGRTVLVVAGKQALKLRARLEGASDQAVQLELAKITGNFKRGNERLARSHPRNR